MHCKSLVPSNFSTGEILEEACFVVNKRKVVIGKSLNSKKFSTNLSAWEERREILTDFGLIYGGRYQKVCP